MPVYRTMEQVIVSIEASLPDIDQIARIGFDTYRRYDPEHRVEHSKAGAAKMIHEHMIAEADRRFIDRDGIKPLNVRGLKVWLFGTAAVLRFKKMDAGGHFRRASTMQANAYDLDSNRFDNQEDLPGIPPAATRIVAGYLLDKTGTAYGRTQIARPIKKGKIDWCVAIVPIEQRQPGKRIWYEVTGQRSLGV